MILTVPVVSYGRNEDVRQAWIRADRMIPWSIVIRDLRIDRSPDVIVKSVSFQSCHVNPREPWCIAWVTLEMPDGYVESPFDVDLPKFVARNDPLGERERLIVSRNIADKMKATDSTTKVAEMHAKIIADCEPDDREASH